MDFAIATSQPTGLHSPPLGGKLARQASLPPSIARKGMNNENKEAAAERKAQALRLAADRWPGILAAAGVPEVFFRKKNGPCPFCGGTDRYRWSDKHDGVWVCNACTDGRYADGFSMLMKHMGFRYFSDAVDHVLSHFGGGAASCVRAALPPAKRRDPQAELEWNMKRMVAVWDAARPISSGDPVDQYLKWRVPGLDMEFCMLRFHPALDYWAPPENDDGKPILLGKFPAMVAKAFDPRGNFVQIHKTYLTLDGRKADVPVVKKTERGIGVNGFAVPMMPVQGDTLGVAEGIESALAGAMLRRIPVWPCLNGPSLAAYDIPDHLVDQVKRVIIFADHDPLKALPPTAGQGGKRYRSAGSHYAEQLSERIRARGKRVLVVKASRVGFDMADHWAAFSSREAAVA